MGGTGYRPEVSMISQAIILEVHNIHLLVNCGKETILVILPPNLRNERRTIDGIDFFPSGDQQRVAHLPQFGLQNQSIFPRYVIGHTIYAAKTTDGYWIDLNVDGRVWGNSFE